MGRGPKPPKGKAKPAVARKSLKNDAARVRDLEERLAEALKDKAEALDQQTATAEVLRVISSSPTDLQPVFDSIAASALRLCDAKLCTAFRFDGELIHLVGSRHVSEEGAAAYRDAYPSRPGRQSGTHRAILTRTIVHIPDIREDAEYELRALARANDYGCVLSVPMLRDGHPVGAITVGREAARPFTNAQIELLKTFADQAVIAIENVRLFTELGEKNRALTEALEQQTATSEVLKVISRSTFDLEPVLDTLIENATRLTGAQQGFIFRPDGELFQLAVDYNAPPAFREWTQRRPIRPGDGSAVGQVALERRAVQILDAQANSAWRAHNANAPGIDRVRTLLGVPMFRESSLVGVIALWRSEIQPFTDKQIELVTTFADQAVIAIENVRLFTELQERNKALTQAHAQVSEALEQQTATSEILKVISSSPTDVRPVFDSIIQNAVRLCGGFNGTVFRFDGSLIHVAAHHNFAPEAADVVNRVFPIPADRGSVTGRAILTRSVIHLPDLVSDAEHTRSELLEAGFRAMLAVPMLRDGAPIGAITVTRRQPEPFSEGEISLLQTFADQAVIAIENVRLFKELEASNREIVEKSRQIEVASQHKSEFLANMSHELRTPLNAIIGFSEVLSDRMFGKLNEKQEEYLKDIYASGTHLLSLINDILDLSKIEAGRMELELTDFHLPTALDNALTLVRERAGRRSITLQMSVDERLGAVQADERKIRQVVLNLLSNALKFTPEGGRIDVAAVPKDGLVEVSVSDTGIGIAPEDQEAVFEEFRQVGTAAKKVEGTGLGLTLCRKFVELHSGRIWVRSQLGVGSTFTFTIPVRRGE